MRLVNGNVALAVLFLASAGCDGCDDERAPRSAADCPPQLRLPVSPRVVEVLEDGSLRPGPACATAHCLSGDEGAWGWRGPTNSTVVVGERVVEVTPVVEDGVCRDPQTVRGFVVTRDLALVERGAELELVTKDGVARVPRPALEPGEDIFKVARFDDGVSLYTRPPGGGVRRYPIVAGERAAPRPGLKPVADDATRRVVGWLQVGSPAALAPADGGPALALPFALGDGALVWRGGEHYVVSDTDHHAWILDGKGALVAEVEHPTALDAWNGRVYVVDGRGAGTIHVVGDHGLEPVLVPAPGHDASGTALPPGARIERNQARLHGGKALLVQRVRTAECLTDDRVVLVDLASKSGRLLATGDSVRLHPTFAGDRFRFVEADASYEQPADSP